MKAFLVLMEYNKTMCSFGKGEIFKSMKKIYMCCVHLLNITIKCDASDPNHFPEHHHQSQKHHIMGDLVI